MQVMKLFFLLFMLSLHLVSEPSETLGKTHFIIAQPTNIIKQTSAPKSPLPLSLKENVSIHRCKILFAPDNNIRNCLLQLIAKEQQAIYLAIFMLTDPEIANALIQAKNKGVIVELVTDVGCLKDRASKIGQLAKEGCSAYIYNPTSSLASKGTSLMHHKFALFEKNENGPRTWTGSYNFTKAANNINQENVVIFSDKETFDTFIEQFKRLKDRSYQYKNNKISLS